MFLPKAKLKPQVWDCICNVCHHAKTGKARWEVCALSAMVSVKLSFGKIFSMLTDLLLADAEHVSKALKPEVTYVCWCC